MSAPNKAERRRRVSNALTQSLSLAYGEVTVADARKAWLSCEMADARALSPMAVLIWMAVMEWHTCATNWNLSKEDRKARLDDLAAIIKTLHVTLKSPNPPSVLAADRAPVDYRSRAVGEHLQSGE